MAKIWETDKEGHFYINPDYLAIITKQSRKTIYNHLYELSNKLIFRVITGSHKERNNSLYFMPILKPLFVEKFIRSIKTIEDFSFVINYCWYRYRWEYICSQEIYYNNTIIKPGELRKIPSKRIKELLPYFEAIHKAGAGKIIREEFLVESMAVCSQIKYMEEVLSGQRESNNCFSELIYNPLKLLALTDLLGFNEMFKENKTKTDKLRTKK